MYNKQKLGNQMIMISNKMPNNILLYIIYM